MARLGVTYQQVAVAASELLDSGRQPEIPASSLTAV